MKKSKIILFLGIILCVVGLASIVYAQTMAERLSGRILLQVEQNGEAWYVNPVDGKRYSMGRPQDAFNLMRELGLGITDSDLNQIPIASLGNLKCTTKPEQGPCKAAIYKYYFDQAENKCKDFIWGGCYGVVPFQTLTECQNTCEN